MKNANYTYIYRKSQLTYYYDLTRHMRHDSTQAQEVTLHPTPYTWMWLCIDLKRLKHTGHDYKFSHKQHVCKE